MNLKFLIKKNDDYNINKDPNLKDKNILNEYNQNENILIN